MWAHRKGLLTLKIWILNENVHTLHFCAQVCHPAPVSVKLNIKVWNAAITFEKRLYGKPTFDIHMAWTSS